MGQLGFAVAGAAIGFAIGGPTGARIGFAAGNFLGQTFFSGSPEFQQEGPRIQSLRVQGSSAGQPIPLIFGRGGHAGHVIWNGELEEVIVEEEVEGGGGKGGGGGGSQKVTTYEYYIDISVSCCEGTKTVTRIWADDLLIYPNKESLNVPVPAIYDGSEDQLQDSVMVLADGADFTPAYRGLVYARWERFPLHEYFYNRIPTFFFEVDGEDVDLDDTPPNFVGSEYSRAIDGPDYVSGQSYQTSAPGTTCASKVDDGQQAFCDACAGAEFTRQNLGVEPIFEESGPKGPYIALWTQTSPVTCAFYRFCELECPAEPIYLVTSFSFSAVIVNATTGTGSQLFGQSLDIDDDADVIVGAPGVAVDGSPSGAAGRAYIFRNGVLETTAGTGGGQNDLHGQTVAINSTSSFSAWAAAGIPGKNGNDGAVEFYWDDAGTWKTMFAASSAIFGITSLQEGLGGNSMAIHDEWGIAGHTNGAKVRIFKRTGDEAIYDGLDYSSGGRSNYGKTVKITDTYAFIAYGGGVHILKRTGALDTDPWTALQDITGIVVTDIDITKDGSRLVVSDSINAKITVYDYDSGSDSWIFQDDFVDVDYRSFGSTVAIYDNGKNIVVGADGKVLQYGFSTDDGWLRSNQGDFVGGGEDDLTPVELQANASSVLAGSPNFTFFSGSVENKGIVVEY